MQAHHAAATSAAVPSRVIIHVDADCFYCQVEAIRLRLPLEHVPLAVQQWQGLIAVSYLARDRGVSRHARADEALKVCPDLCCVHVETIGDDGGAGGDGEQQQEQQQPKEAETAEPAGVAEKNNTAAADDPYAQARRDAAAATAAAAATRATRKASLRRYRRASAEVLQALTAELAAELSRGAAAHPSSAAVADSTNPNALPPAPPASTLAAAQMIEKASIDEWYVDATAAAAAELRSRGLLPATGPSAGHEDDGERDEDDEAEAEALRSAAAAQLVAEAEAASNVEAGQEKQQGEGQAPPAPLQQLLHPSSSSDLLLAAGAVVAARLRAGVARRTAPSAAAAAAAAAAETPTPTPTPTISGYRLSAGIGTNKLLAKVGSARKKPDAQTLVLPRGVPALMASLPLEKLRGFGGKLGAALSSPPLSARTAGDVASLASTPAGMHQLERALGGADRAQWAARQARGDDGGDPVAPRALAKQLGACKSFPPTRAAEDVAHWLRVLADEVAERVAEDHEDHRRRPGNLVLSWRQASAADELAGGVEVGGDRSTRTAFPFGGWDGTPAAAAKVAEAAAKLFRVLPPHEVLPVGRLSLAAADFSAAPTRAQTGAMAAFLQAGAKQQKKRQEEQEEAGGGGGGGSGGCGKRPRPGEEEEVAAAVAAAPKPAPKSPAPKPPLPPPPPAAPPPSPVDAVTSAAAEELGVDVEEQRRILAEIERRQAFAGGGRGAGAGGGGGGGRGRGGGPLPKNQPRIDSMFQRKPKAS